MPQFRYTGASPPLCLRAVLVAVPEAPVHEDRPSIRSIREVRGSWQITVSQTVSTTKGCDQLSHLELRTGAGLLDRLHHTRAGGWRNNIPWPYQSNILGRCTCARLLRCLLESVDDIVFIQGRGCPACTGLSTNASCQPEKPENWYSKTWGSTSTLGLSLHPSAVSFPTGETARRARTCGMWRIRARRATGAAVKIMSVGIWYADGVAPRRGFEPRFTAPKAAVLPLDDRGILWRLLCSV